MKFKYLAILLIVCSCARGPDLPPVIDNFEVNRYLGKWYEIARYDNHFEKNLDNGTAFYYIHKPNRIEVFNQGYNPTKDYWKKAEGFIRLNPDDPNKGLLRVTFLWPFFADYRILYVDEYYQYAIVSSNSFKYLWILSRTPTISEDKKAELLEIIKTLNYDTEKLIYPKHDKVLIK